MGCHTKERFPGAHILGWVIVGIAILLFLAAVWDGVRNGFGFLDFFVRFLAVFYAMEIYDIIFFDWVLLCHSNFFPHTQALVAALAQGKLGGAAIDVFDEEPLPEGHPLFKLPNVTLTPHSAGTTVDAFSNSVDIIRDQFEQLLAGKTPRNKVN